MNEYINPYASPDLLQAGKQAAEKAGVPWYIFNALIQSESSWNPNAVGDSIPGSSERARGIAQFLPSTAQSLKINPDDPMQALPAAAQYLADLKAKSGSWGEAVALYKGYGGGGGVTEAEKLTAWQRIAKYFPDNSGAFNSQIDKKPLDTIAKPIAGAVDTVQSAGEWWKTIVDNPGILALVILALFLLIFGVYGLAKNSPTLKEVAS